MKNVLSINLLFLLLSTAANATDCSAIGGKFESVVNSTNVAPARQSLQTASGKLDTLIRLCKGKVKNVEWMKISNNFKLDVQPKGSCDLSTIGGQAQEAISGVNGKISSVISDADVVAHKTDMLASIFLKCIGK